VQVIPDDSRPSDASIKVVNGAGFQTSSTFLASLPGVARCLSSATDASVSWPGFSESNSQIPANPPWESGKAKQRKRETCLLDGIVQGIEVSTLSVRWAIKLIDIGSQSEVTARQLFSIPSIYVTTRSWTTLVNHVPPQSLATTREPVLDHRYW
jgi:hypothetical protein